MRPIDRLLADPWGAHDPEVTDLARGLRIGPIAGKLVLVALGGGRCALARLPATRPGPVERLGPEYESVIEGERDILRRRWEAST